MKYDITQQDNLEYMLGISDESVQLIITSPPYNIGKSYEVKKSLADWIEEQKTVIKECVRIIDSKGSICWQTGNYVDQGEIFPLDTILYPIFKEYGLKLKNRIVWTYAHGLHCKHRFSGRYETILWFSKTDRPTFNLDSIRIPSKYPGKRHWKGPRKGELSGNVLGKNPGDVWEIPNVKANHVEKTAHPCQFPVGLAARLVLALSNPGDKVFDPYMGSGSTAIATLLHDRVAMGCDQKEEYVKIALERIKDLKSGQLKIREMNKPILPLSRD